MENQNNSTGNITRRNFILCISGTGAAVVIGSALKPLNALGKEISKTIDYGILEYHDNCTTYPTEILDFVPSVWLEIKTNNTIYVSISRTEMGQGIRTSFATAVADEMDADWANIRVVQAPPDNAKYGSQNTGGSYSTMYLLDTIRKAGATARAMLISAAAKTWNIAESSCKADKSYISEIGGNRKLSYGELSDLASTLSVPGTVKTKSAGDFNYMGTINHFIDMPDFVNGRAIYGSDVYFKDLKYAVAAFPPAIGASVKSVDDSATLKIPGVIKTIRAVGGVVVIADNTWAAIKGVKALNITWNMGNNATLNSADITKSMTDKIGSLGSLPANTDKTLEVTYQVPYLAHAPMEPLSCTVYIQGNKCDVWTSTQDSQSVQSTAASATGIPLANVTVHMNLAGGAFGRRSSSDFVQNAATIAKQSGYPIKFLYMREDDIKYDRYRPASIHAMKAGLDSAGKITGWIHKGIFAGSGSVQSPPYSLPSPQNSNASGITTIPTGAWRSVAASQVVFANESCFDELAVLAGKDPLDFRLGIATNQRVKAVLNELKTRSNWGNPLPKRSGRGVAVFTGWNGYCGHVVEVTIGNNGKVIVDRVVCVADVGFAVSPFGIESQMMGGIIDGLSTALKAEITIDKGIAEQTGYSDFKWLRFNESPKIEVYILQNGSASGVGELGFPTVSPALCNAIYNAVGIRIRRLPISHTDLSTTSVAEPVSNHLKVFPNPFNDSLTIDMSSIDLGDEVDLEISDLSGRIVYRTSFQSISIQNSITLNLLELRAGSYVISLTSNSKKYQTKVIKM
jgi:isoquinoline 1-oxidoreductase beta subunit